ncbi:MAG: hypothetical protein JWP59_4503 [Massilia sp.]|nr:hypothetical protein [Massilia sp.]
MKNRILLLCIALIVSMAAWTALVYAGLPALLAIHWDMAGNVNGVAPRAFLFGHVGLMAAVLLLWLWLPALSPQRFGVDSFKGTYWRIGLLVVAMLAFIHAMLLWTALSPAALPPAPHMAAAAAAVFIGLLGNVMGKVKRNFWIGIRTPWTLASERVWYTTHRLAGKTMVGGAALSLIGTFAGLPTALCIAVALAGVLAPAAYSLIAYRRIESGRA